MIPAFLQEQRRYLKSEIQNELGIAEEQTVQLLKKLKEYGVVKATKKDDMKKDLTDLLECDIEVADVEVGENEYFYVFTFVGIVMVGNYVLKCFPKYLLREQSFSATEARDKYLANRMKFILKVISKYNAKEQIIRMTNDTEDGATFNKLAVMLFLLNDYYENGLYNNVQGIIEVNGSGEILWEKTINETFTLISNNRPYCPELLTKRKINDDSDYFKRLHECVLTKISKELQDTHLLELFEISEVELTDEELDDFGDSDYILERIEKELNVQFNTRKQLLLKTLYAYVANKGKLSQIDCFSIYGTNSFNLVWEKACAEVLDNQLNTPLRNLGFSLHEDFADKENEPLIKLIEKPQWCYCGSNGMMKSREASDTLIPDIVSICGNQFLIFDAKYYVPSWDGETFRGYPGIESVTKQYLYQLAYKDFVDKHKFDSVKNCFLMPTENKEVVKKGIVKLDMMKMFKLKDIQVRLLPDVEVYQDYIYNRKFDIGSLDL